MLALDSAHPVRPIHGRATTLDLPSSVLVAEDEHLIAELLADQVRSLGCRLMGPAANGEQALELARRERPDLALMDIRMPRMDGLTAARMMWDELGVPIVIISAFSEDEMVNRSMETGVFGYLIKPAGHDALRVAMAVAWRRYREHSASHDRVAQLEKTLEQRRLVEQAKWKLVSDKAIAEPEAHRRLQATARRLRMPISAVAERVLAGEVDIVAE